MLLCAIHLWVTVIATYQPIAYTKERYMQTSCKHWPGHIFQGRLLVMLRPSVHAVQSTVFTVMIQESISLQMVSTRKGIPNCPYPAPTNAWLELFVVKIWKHTRRNVLLKWSSVSTKMWAVGSTWLVKIKSSMIMRRLKNIWWWLNIDCIANAQHELSYTKEQLAAALKQITNLTFLMNTQLTTMNLHPRLPTLGLSI